MGGSMGHDEGSHGPSHGSHDEGSHPYAHGYHDLGSHGIWNDGNFYGSVGWGYHDLGSHGIWNDGKFYGSMGHDEGSHGPPYGSHYRPPYGSHMNSEYGSHSGSNQGHDGGDHWTCYDAAQSGCNCQCDEYPGDWVCNGCNSDCAICSGVSAEDFGSHMNSGYGSHMNSEY